MQEPNHHINLDIALVGGGPSSLFAATLLLEAGFNVGIFEYKSALAKKLNIAAKSGLNLSNDKEGKTFIGMYGKDSNWIDSHLTNFNNVDLRSFFNEKFGLETYVGSSGKVFPKADLTGARFIKIWIDQLKKIGLVVYTHHQFIGWDSSNNLRILDKSDTELTIGYKKAMLALGGMSWPMTGSDGNWTTVFESKGIKLNPWQSSNCGIHIKADAAFFEKWNGHFLKNVGLKFKEKKVVGEIRISRYGLEGKPVYHLVPEIRDVLSLHSNCQLSLDFKTNSSSEELMKKLSGIKENSLQKILKKLAVHPSFSMLLKIYKLKYSNSEELVGLIKSFPIEVEELGDIANAISVVGGVCKEELDKNLMLKRLPNNYLAGEMIDWDAPTGGYLLQACFSMAKTVTDSMIEDLKF